MGEDFNDEGYAGRRQEEEEQRSFERESIEDILYTEQKKAFGQRGSFKDPVNNYQPVLYEIIKDPAARQEKESFSEIQAGFIQRSENLLKIFHQRAHIHDGLKNLSDTEIIRKVRESPTKLKSAAKSFLRKLRKLNVTLN